MQVDRCIRWIAFDAVGTLIFADPPVHIAYYRAGRRHGSALSPEQVRARFRESYARYAARLDEPAEILGDCVTSEAAAAPEVPVGEAAERRFWRSIVGEVFPDVTEVDACFEELFAYFAEPRAWGCFADVEETVTELRARGYRTAIASNFDARLHRICDGMAELSSIERQVISSEVGRRKPDEGFYRALLESCGCRCDELLVVGDDPINDVAAARKMGIRSLQVDRRGDSVGEALRSLTDLLNLLPANP